MWLQWLKANIRLQHRSQPHDTIEQTCLHDVKVKLTLNTASERSHKGSRVYETLLEELWRKEHGSGSTATLV